MKRFPWDNLHVLLAVIRAGTLREAARSVRMSTATLSRRLDTLEERLGGKLVERTANGCAPTELGLRVLIFAEQMEVAAHGILREVETPAELTGTLRVNADEWTSFLLIGLLPGLKKAHPGLNVDVLTSQEPFNLARREADVVMRYAPPETSDLIGLAIGDVSFSLYASEAYISEQVSAIDQQQWEGLDFISLDEPRSDFEVERWLRGLAGAPKPWLRCNYALGVLDGVAAGGGLGIIENNVARINPGLNVVLPAPQLTRQVWLWVHHSLHDTLRIQTLIHYLRQSWNQP
ncbi:LysR family transcriptional regulator [Salinimonas lutimaris]|uniref:LysR family transcriptional regulator n=1 Tax=Salinimonas lutimaris TaxID=914153 RepID=UPI0010C03A00|nr:LysR family transcriptional regulator [Salinimonas lutimaris]